MSCTRVISIKTAAQLKKEFEGTKAAHLKSQRDLEALAELKTSQRRNEQKNRNRMNWQESDEYAWERMGGDGVCEHCARLGEFCHRIVVRTAKEKSGEKTVTYSRCQLCKVCCRKCNEYTVKPAFKRNRVIVLDDDDDTRPAPRITRRRDVSVEIAEIPAARRINVEEPAPMLKLEPEVVINSRPPAKKTSVTSTVIAPPGSASTTTARLTGLEKEIQRMGKVQTSQQGALEKIVKEIQRLRRHPSKSSLYIDGDLETEIVDSDY